MASLQSLLEDYRNWIKTQEWKNKKQDERLFGGDPVLQEEFEKWSGGFSPSNLGGGLSGLAGAIKASHGGPHAFTKFDFSKIGSGEGAQAYGHGGYFAQGFDSPVAKQYQKDLSGFYEPFLGERVGQNLSDIDLEVLKALEIGKRNAGQFPHNTTYYAKQYAADKPELLAAIEALPRDVKFGERLNTGNLYNVELKWPDAAKEAADPLGEHHLLDWLAPYEQQPQNIQDLLAQTYESVANKRTGIREGLRKKFATQSKAAPIREEMSPITGQQLYDQIASELNSRELASKYLAQQGIPGISYLGTSSGKRNYVMFDDRFPNIVSRNGVSLADLLRK